MAQHQLGSVRGRADLACRRHEEARHARVVRDAHRLHQVHAGVVEPNHFHTHHQLRTFLENI